MANTPAAAKKFNTDTEAAPAERQVKPITDVKRNSEGFHFQTWLVRLPKGVILQDLNDRPAELWSQVQSDQNRALHKFDVVHVVDFDETWMATAIVGFADHSRVVLSGIKKVDLPARNEMLFSDENYEVLWAGAGYGVFRKRDGVRVVPSSFQTPEQAKIALINLYGRRAA